MFKFLRKLFCSERSREAVKVVHMGEPIRAMSSRWFSPVRELSEHQRNRQRLFTMVAQKEGAQYAKEALEAFDKAFPDQSQSVRLPRPLPDGTVMLADVELALVDARVNFIPWNAGL